MCKNVYFFPTATSFTVEVHDIGITWFATTSNWLQSLVLFLGGWNNHGHPSIFKTSSGSLLARLKEKQKSKYIAHSIKHGPETFQPLGAASGSIGSYSCSIRSQFTIKGQRERPFLRSGSLYSMWSDDRWSHDVYFSPWFIESSVVVNLCKVWCFKIPGLIPDKA